MGSCLNVLCTFVFCVFDMAVKPSKIAFGCVLC